MAASKDEEDVPTPSGDCQIQKSSSELTGPAVSKKECDAMTPTGDVKLKKGRLTLAAMVCLHIYDVVDNFAIEYMNSLFRILGTGAFHVAVEVYGEEWSYGYLDTGTGVFNCLPGQNKEYGHHRESIELGYTDQTPFEVDVILDKLSKAWPGKDYNLLRHNCVHFSEEFCRQLCVGPFPDWVLSLAHAGAVVVDGSVKVLDTPKEIMVKMAKAGERHPDVHAETSLPDDHLGVRNASGKSFLERLDSASLAIKKSSGRHLGTKRPDPAVEKSDEATTPPDKGLEATTPATPPSRRRCCGLLPAASKGSS